MKKLYLLVIGFLLSQASAFPQIVTEKTNAPVFFKVKSHDTNITKLPEKSFYESKADWQYIIDTTWGPGIPLQNKQIIFNYFADRLHDNFDGFESLNFTTNTWDSLRYCYYTKIDSNTSKGRFAAIMFHFARQLSDLHTWAYDVEVVETALNPGVPLLVVSGFCNVEHFGAVLSALEDSTIFVLRAVNNHPLGLEPGDIILGYNGELWVNLIQELLEAELPGNGAGSTKNGGTTSSQSSITHNLLICAGMNWHLFDTIDIVKLNSGDTLHLSVSPLLNLNVPPMLNNEQLEIPNIPFPNYFNNEPVSYGILPNTSIGYIYVISESIPSFAGANQQFNSAALALKDVDALIIDMRWNEGGNAFWQDAFRYWTNEIVYTLEWAFRCNPTDFSLCFDGDTTLASVQGQPPGKYQRPIAVLLGPICKSMGDINAYRLSYLDNIKSFGKSTAAGLGYNILVQGYQGFNFRYSIADIAHITNPSNFLNRKEFPVDFPVWHNPNDVAQGKDAVVEAALEWIDNLVYGYNVVTDNQYYISGNDTANISAMVENPNSNNISAKVFIENLENTFIDSIELAPTESSEIWQGDWLVPNAEDIYKLKIKAIDNTLGESFSFSNVQRISTAGPVVIDLLDVTYLPVPKIYQVKPYIKNKGQSFTIENLTISLLTFDSTVSIISGTLSITSIAPGEIVVPSGSFTVRVDSNFTGTFNFNFEITSNEWLLWKDSVSIVTSVEDGQTLPISYKLFQNYPNPFNPITTIEYQIPEFSFVTIKVYDVLGNEVKTLVNEELSPGEYKIDFNTSSINHQPSSGVYFYQLKAGDFIQTKKMVLMK